MRRWFPIRLFLFALMSPLICSRPVAAAEVTGTWKLTVATPRGSQTAILKLKHTGSMLSGTFSDGAHEMPIQEGTLKGNDLQFSLAGKKGPDRFKLHIDGDRMKGTLKGGMGSWNLTGARQRDARR